MIVRSVDTYFVAPHSLFVRIGTDGGIVGWGEAGVQTNPWSVAAAIHELSEQLVGANPLSIEHHWQVLTKGRFFRGGPDLASAVASIDIALWDIAGRVHGVPVHELLGGPVRERMRVYAWLGAEDGEDDPTVVATEAAAKVRAGYTALKLVPSTLTAADTPARLTIVARVEAVREAVGPEIDVMIDCHGRCSKAMAKRLLPLLESAKPMFVEEPVLPEYPEALSELAAISSVPIATGERLYSRWEFKNILGRGVDIIQPDVAQAGGISETRRIAAFAETYDVAMAPHCAIGVIALAASLQICFAAPNAIIQEQGLDVFGPPALEYLVDDSIFKWVDGYADRPTSPGLGIEIDETAVKNASRRDHRWSPTPRWHPDGAFAEW